LNSSVGSVRYVSIAEAVRGVVVRAMAVVSVVDNMVRREVIIMLWSLSFADADRAVAY